MRTFLLSGFLILFGFHIQDPFCKKVLRAMVGLGQVKEINGHSLSQCLSLMSNAELTVANVEFH